MKLYTLVISEAQRQEIITCVTSHVEMHEDELRCENSPRYPSDSENVVTARKVLPILQGIIENLVHDVVEVDSR